MTLVVCLKGVDGLVLGADSRGTVGDPRGLTAIRDSEQKLFGLSRYSGIVTYGQAELGARLISEVMQELSRDQIIEITPVVDKTREIIRRCYGQWFQAFPIDKRPGMGFILGGMEGIGEGKFDMKIYYLSSHLDFAPQLSTSGMGLGGIPQYATYLLHRFYEANMKRDNLLRLAAYVIAETATQDPKVGGPIRLAQISFEEGFKPVDDASVQEMLRQNEHQNQRMKSFFTGSPPKV